MEMLSFPDPPNFSDEEIAIFTKNKNFKKYFFEWYHHLRFICSISAAIYTDSEDIIQRPKLHYAILAGLMNRCSRLMFSVIKLSHKNECLETISILTRCIAETATRIQWLIKKDDDESYNLYLTASLKSELSLIDEINKNTKYFGNTIKIENRMLNSMKNHIDLAGLTEEQIRNSKRNFPNLQTIFNELNLKDLHYITIQRLGSHSVHGNWSDLLFYYIDVSKDGSYQINGGTNYPREECYVMISLILLDTLISYYRYFIKDESYAEEIINVLLGYKVKLLEKYKILVSGDWDIIS